MNLLTAIPPDVPDIAADGAPGTSNTDHPESPPLIQRGAAWRPQAVPVAAEVFAFRQQDHGAKTFSPPGSTALRGPAKPAVGSDGSDLPLYERNTTLIPSGWVFKGRLEAENDVALDCSVEGEIVVQAGHACHLNASSSVEGTLRSDNLNMHGVFSGSVDSSGGKVTIHPTARISGDVVYTQINMLGGQHTMSITHKVNA